MTLWTGTHIAKNIWVGPLPMRPMSEFHAVAFCAQELQPESKEEALYLSKYPILCPLDDTLEPMAIEVVLRVMATARVVCDLSRRGPVAVTCHMGINRSALVAATALHLRLGEDGDRVRRLVQQRRPGTLRNTQFASFVDNLKAKPQVTGQVRVNRRY